MHSDRAIFPRATLAGAVAASHRGYDHGPLARCARDTQGLRQCSPPASESENGTLWNF